MMRYRIRNLILGSFAFLLAFSAVAPAAAQDAKKVMVLGIDGLDPKILQRFVDEGKLPNFARMIEEGDFKPLQTTMPPLSPVAWSTFISGMDPAGHGIFDFVHRDPATMLPFLAMAKEGDSEEPIAIGKWTIPRGGGIELMRKGQSFWNILEENGIPTTVFRMPANFPPSPSPGKSFSGMGTPDITGSPGTFSFFTEREPRNADDISGGEVYKVRVRNGKVEADLIGPENPFKGKRKDEKSNFKYPKMKSPFTVYVDNDARAAKIVLGNEEFLLKEGEWSGWKVVEFEAIPYLKTVTATARFYLQEVRPFFKLYVSPLQINPGDPAMPISTPAEWSHDLCEEIGYFYTQELPEDTKALSGGIFTGQEFWTQAQSVYTERRHALNYFLDNFDEGFLFFYFSSVDQGCHMMWRYVDEAHPGYDGAEGLGHGIETLYKEMDEALGHVRKKIGDDTTLIVMSDHGFSPFYWGVNLNSWLVEKGYVVLKDPSKQGQMPFFGNVDWGKTTAYALGLNGLYINLFGREKNGVVLQNQYQALLDSLERDLLEFYDQEHGHSVVTLVTQTKRDFKGNQFEFAPDIIVGYNKGYRTSWESPLGEFPKQIIVDNAEAWSGDHSIDYRHVPGVLLSNKKITIDSPALYDLTVAVLDEYGIKPSKEMIGQDCIGDTPQSANASP